MSYLRLILLLAIFIQAIPSWGWGTVIIGDKEWYRTADISGYCREDFYTLCPGGICEGSLGGNDLTGWTWASIEDVSDLFNHYIGSNKLSGLFEYMESDPTFGEAIIEDFGFNDTGFDLHSSLIIGWVSTGLYTATAGTDGADNSWAYIHAYPDRCFAFGAWFWRPAGDGNIRIRLEEPINAQFHSGIGNLRGWAIATGAIDRVEIYIDGKYAYDAPYGGERTDVAEVYPDIAGSDNSGFSLAFGYSNLGVGQHTVTARAFDMLGEYMESTATFEIVAFDKDFINKWAVVDLSPANMSVEGDEILLEDVWVDGELYDLKLRWRTAEQGFEIIEIQ